MSDFVVCFSGRSASKHYFKKELRRERREQTTKAQAASKHYFKKELRLGGGEFFPRGLGPPQSITLRRNFDCDNWKAKAVVQPPQSITLRRNFDDDDLAIGSISPPPQSITLRRNFD